MSIGRKLEGFPAHAATETSCFVNNETINKKKNKNVAMASSGTHTLTHTHTHTL